MAISEACSRWTDQDMAGSLSAIFYHIDHVIHLLAHIYTLEKRHGRKAAGIVTGELWIRVLAHILAVIE